MAEKDLRSKAKIRFFMAVNNTQYVDVFINGKLIVSMLPFREESNYFALQPGKYKINIFSISDQKRMLLSTNIIIETGKIYTLAVAINEENNHLLLYQNDPEVPLGEAKMRLLHLAYNVGNLDLAVKDRDVVFPNVSFQQVTDYLGLTPMTIDLELRIAGTKQVVLPIPKCKFKENETCTLILTGSDKELCLSMIID